jgi:hypothetical protein
MNAFYIPDRVVEAGSDLVPSIETVGLPHIDSREDPFPKCAFSQSPHKNNIGIACKNKN